MQMGGKFVSSVQTCTGPDPPGSPAVHRPVRLPGPQVWVLLLVSSELHWNVIEIATLLGEFTEDCDLNTSPKVLEPTLGNEYWNICEARFKYKPFLVKSAEDVSGTISEGACRCSISSLSILPAVSVQH